MRYLVTGAQGFVGRFLCAALLRQDPNARVMGLGRSRQSTCFTHRVSLNGQAQPAPLPTGLLDASSAYRYSYHTGNIHDVQDTTALLCDFEPQVIFHLASGLPGDSTEILCHTNIEGTAKLLEAVVAAKIVPQRIVLGSSGGVYGMPQTLPLDETHPTAPVDLYSMSKLAAESAGSVFAYRHQLPIIAARIFNIIGPGQEERHVCGRFASLLVSAEQGGTRTLEVGNLSPTRDFIDVRDVATGLAAIGANGEPGSVVNVATGVETSLQQVLDTLIALADVAVEVVSQHGRPAEIARHVGCAARLEAMDWTPQYSLRESLSDLLTWYRKLEWETYAYDYDNEQAS